MDLTGELQNDPQKVGTPAADLLSGSDAALGCLAALADRTRTGRGHFVEVSLVESMTRFLTPRIVSYLGGGDVPRRSGAKDSVIAIYQTFATADDPLTLSVPNDAIWRRLCTVLQRPDLAQDAGLATNAGRIARRQELVGTIAALLAEKPRAIGCPSSASTRCRQVRSTVLTKSFRTRNCWIAASSTRWTMADSRSRRSDWASASTAAQRATTRRPPALGADTAAVLAELAGVQAGDLETYKQSGVI
jgi:crotonobetainyl-CoA:carnitine CoA-transferase CaiB-like acyl-CoA transferase